MENRVLPWSDETVDAPDNHSSWLKAFSNKLAALINSRESSSGQPSPQSVPFLLKRADEFDRLFSPPSKSNRRLPATAPSLPSSKQQQLRILGLAVNGWFPEARLMQTIFGEPVGTSARFCTQFQSALLQWFNESTTTAAGAIAEHKLTMVPLTSQVGTVKDRLQSHLAELQAHRSTFQQATHIFVLAHSQGSPVSTILLHRLLVDGWISMDRTKVLLLSMAGIAHGPFPWIRRTLVLQYVETAAASRELFDFCYAADDLLVPDTSSEGASPGDKINVDQLSTPTETVRLYWESMRVLLCSGVRVLALASYRDQVVPLYSALMTGWSHPNLKRAIYFDHFNYGGDEDFLCSLLVLLVRLRNRGLSDHNLLVYLSDYLAGSLYSVGGSAAASGGEHSTIYDDPRVYQLAISMLLSGDGDDNTAFASQPVVLTPFHISARQNPNYLPWAMHGLLVNSELRRSDQALLRELHAILIRRLRQWRPTERPLRDLAYRLHPVRQLSRL